MTLGGLLAGSTGEPTRVAANDMAPARPWVAKAMMRTALFLATSTG